MQPGFLDSIRNLIDKIDDEIDNLESWPIVGSFAKSIATIVDPIRKEVDKLDPQSTKAK